MEKPILQDSPSFVDLCTLHQHAMRYYRLWIYACNTVLALATLVFTVFAVSVIVDPRASLLTGVEFYQPTFLYAFVALVFQCGVLQAIGCIGALRLNQRLLNIYWVILLVLMVGDIITGLIWAFRLDHIKSNLRPMLRHKMITLYGKDEDFTEVWDWVQTNDMCCGVDGPIDFLRINDSTFGALDPNDLGNDNWASYLLRQQEQRLQNQQTIPKLPSTCCIFTVNHALTTPETPISSEVPGGGGGGSSRSRSHHKGRGGGGGGGTSKGDRLNDPMNQIPIPGGYYQQPQQLKGSFQNSNYNDKNYNYNSNNQNNNNPPLSYPDNYINTYMNNYNRNNNNNTSSEENSRSSVFSNNLVISNLRQSPLTDQITGAPVSPMGYFAPGAPAPHPMGGTMGSHNRRKIAHAKNKHHDDYGYLDRTRWPGKGLATTTEGPPSGRSPPPTLGVCVLPSNLRQPHSSYSASSNSAGESSNSFEDSSEMFSTTSLPPPHSTSSSIPGTSSTTMPNINNESTAASRGSTTTTETPSLSSTSSTSVPPSPTPSSSSHSKNNRGSSSSNSGSQHHRHHHQSIPFTVSMEQHTDNCGDKMLEWIEYSSDVLFVIGFCIIVFLKGCFIAILRYEIKEMIEKIKLMNGEDPGRTAAMNELIGLTSIYETGNDDNGETEGLMSNNGNQDINTNVDTIDGDNGSGGAVMISSGCTGDATRKDSVHYVKENHLIGNNVGPPRHIGNHVGSIGNPSTVNNDDYPRVLGVTRDSIGGTTTTVPAKHDLEEDFIDSSALLGNKHTCSGISGSPPIIGNSKHYLQFHHRNENGGRNVPRNGNNNNSGGRVAGALGTTTGSFESATSGVPTSASAPSIPIDAIARVTNAPIH